MSSILEDEATNAEDNLEEKLDELTSVAERFGVDTYEIKKKLKGKMEKQEEESDNAEYDWDSEGEDHRDFFENDDHRLIDSWFDSLRTEKEV